MEFVIKQGDISLEEADALVNAAGTSLVMGSGVAGALRRRGRGRDQPGCRCPRAHWPRSSSRHPRPIG